MSPSSQPAYLIVNADDYGYFDCVSQGILDSARYGIVTATGIFANTTHFDKHVSWLQDFDDLDLGVHLNLTEGEPLTLGVREKLSRWGGRFPGKYTVARAIISGSINAEDIKLEWKAQIERCLEKGLNLRFLNSHEHIYMLPILFPLVQALAKEYGIPHIRFPTPELLQSWAIGALVRDTLMKILGMLNRVHLTGPTAYFLGMGESGRLNISYLEHKFPKLKPSHVYELMCHPGHCNTSEILDPHLLSYHDWEGEFNTLTSPAVKELCNSHGIRLIGYKNLVVKEGQLMVTI